ncbi:hypothetical protein ERN12_05550 [Rhodobacteraceae bacterium]|nr:hypothetical protein ERN12_05550 [Paracoccaceae bacterium]
MARKATSPQASASPVFNVICVAQSGRLEYEAILFVRSFRETNPDFKGRLIVAEPSGARWNSDTRLSEPVRDLLLADNVEIIGFDNQVFGESYPYGNKIEALGVMPAEPFIFFDTDTVFTGKLSDLNIDFNSPAASMKREGTWPEPPLYGPGYTEIWKCLYDRFGLPFEQTLDLSKPNEFWERYLYFNAGWFFGPDAQEFGRRWVEYAVSIRDDTPDELACQTFDPWLDQVALPLVITSFGGGRPGPELDGLDGRVTCHYRTLPLLYAREHDAAIEMVQEAVAPNRVKKVVKAYDPIKKLVIQRKGEKIREMFDQSDLPVREQVIRNTIKRAKLWMR